MHVVFGLGNPGKRYLNTRHNIGFIFLDYIQSIYKVPFRAGKGDYYFSEITLFDKTVYLVKPTTYMNNSGLAVAQVVESFGLSEDSFLIVHDDFHLPFGKIRFKSKGSAGGHNGIKSIIFHLGTENFSRLKIGIGPPPAGDVIDFVLSDFSTDEKKRLESVLKLAFNGLQTWVRQGIRQAMNDFNGEQINFINAD